MNKRQNRKEKLQKKIKKLALITILMLFIMFAGVVSYGYSILKSFGKDTIDAKRVPVSEPVNILVLGVDAGDYESKSKNSPKRSDTMMLVHYEPENNKVYMLSIPRDTRISINGHVSKINTAHAIGGPELAIKTVEKMLSVDINYYVKLDYEGFRQCIDAIGGIDVVIPRDMDYDAVDIHIHFKKGEKVHLDGKKAEEFVRWRKNNDGGGYAMGDLGRQGTQQEFLIKVIEKMKTPAGFIKLPALMKTVSSYVKTNIAPMDLIKYSYRLKSVNTSDIEKENLKGEPKYISGVSYYIWNRDLSDSFLKNFRMMGSNEFYKGGKEDKDNRDAKITILNATGISGQAAKYAEKLKGLGFKFIETGNYPKKLSVTKIEDYTPNGYGDTIHDLLKIGKVSKMEKEDEDKGLVIILGLDSIK